MFSQQYIKTPKGAKAFQRIGYYRNVEIPRDSGSSLGLGLDLELEV